MAEIDFFTFIIPGMEWYANFLRECGNSLKSGKHNINWKCIVSGDTNKYPSFFDIHHINKHKCEIHGVAMNRAVEISNSKYVVFADADICILYKNWDDLIVKKLKNKFSCFGFGGTYHNNIWSRVITIPSVMFFCFRKEIMNNIKVDFTPIFKRKDQIMRKKIISKKDTRITGLKKGCFVDCETGYKIAFLAYKYKWKSFLLKRCFSNSKNVKLPFPDDKRKKQKCKNFVRRKKDHMAEWHFGNKLFGTHLRKGREKEKKNPYSRIWKNRIISFMKKEYNIKIKSI